MTLATPDQLQAMLLGGRTPRFLQESPILRDVWSCFAQHPQEPADLLLTVHEQGRSAAIAVELREALRRSREGRDPEREAASVAPLAGLVAARVHLDELFSIVLPMTTWWTELAPGPALREEPRRAALTEAVERMRRRQPPAAEAGGALPDDLVWVVSAAGALLAAAHSEGAAPGEWPPSAERSVAAFLATVPLDSGGRPAERTFWRVALNRHARPATLKSVLAIKADAAMALFSITCAHLTWAILDCGIDREHPAFQTGKESRIVKTYDFTLVRDLLDPARLGALIAELQAGGEPAGLAAQLKARISAYIQRQNGPEAEAPDMREVAQFMMSMRRRLETGLEVEMAMLEPFIELTAPEPPELGHGTHVAGILGAKWTDPQTQKPKLLGVCPDIRMIDMRVLPHDDPDGKGSEFAVIAALQFIRQVNARSNQRVIHGANLSLYTHHDVRNNACGATPVCQACDALVASGVVVVAAAGNEGHRVQTLADGAEVVGYLSISITDPGNADGVITVGSAHRERPHQYGVSYFSSRGPTGDGRRKPDLVAPGERIVSTLPGEALGPRDGTSQAAPHVSGAAALLMGRHSELIGRPGRIKQILCETASDLGRDRYFQGAGLVDVLRALQSI